MKNSPKGDVMRPVISVFLALVTVTVLLLSSCGRAAPPPSASEVLTAMLEAAEATTQPLPDGVIRLTSAPPDSPNRLTETFFSALYGEMARGLLSEGENRAPLVQDAALYLSASPYPCELGVFRCADGGGAEEVADLCLGRLDTLARGFAGGEYEAVAAKGRVAVVGNWVLLVLCEDPTPLLETARRLVG